MNKRWYCYMDYLMETFDEIESLGIDTESCLWLDNLHPSPESQLIMTTLDRQVQESKG